MSGGPSSSDSIGGPAGPVSAGDGPAPLWRPGPERAAASGIERFRRQVLPGSVSGADLWRFSIEEPGRFWGAVWDWCGVLGERGTVGYEPAERFWEARFCPDASLNLAENLLAERPGAAAVAIVASQEDGGRREITWAELRAQVAALAAVLREAGVEPGDRVAAWMPHLPETVVAFLAAASVGAVFSSTSADFGVDGVVDRFGQIGPKVLVAADGYRYGGRELGCLDRLGLIRAQLPSLVTTLVVGNLDPAPDLTPVPTPIPTPGQARAQDGSPAGDSGAGRLERWDAALARHEGAGPSYERLPFDHPIYILFSSGTTGKPKCIVHRAGGVLLKHLSEQRLHCDINPGDRILYFTTCGWMMWNWLVSALGCGATIVLHDGNPGWPHPAALFEVADELAVTLLGVSAKYVDSVMKSGARPRDRYPLPALRSICSTGSPLSHEGFAWLYDAVAPDAHLASISGGTDLCGCLVLGDPTLPVHAGEIQTRALGVAVDIFDDEGQPVGPGVKGELVCTRPFPSMPLRFWDDDDGSRYRAAYFERFEGVWAHGDYASWTERGGMVIHGRSDATLNASGVRIGTAEIYRVVEQLDEVAEAIAIGQQWGGDTRIVLFVRLAPGAVLDDTLVARIKAELRTRCSPRHVPAVVVPVPDIPRTRSGKIVELAVTDVVHGRPVKNREALANPEALDRYADRPELS